jgi:two-component system, chemotaxis family, sensor kinase CheA
VTESFQIDREALLRSFTVESAEVLTVAEEQLLALERNPEDEEAIHSLFRVAHTLKGSAGMVGLVGISELAHAVENLLERLRSRMLRADADLVSLLLRGTDVFRLAISAAVAGDAEPAEAGALRRDLDRLLQGAQAGNPSPHPHPEAPASPVAPHHHAEPRTLRVDVGKLDRMLNLAGEIAVSRARMEDMLQRRIPPAVDELQEVHREADRLYLDLQDLIMRSRMVPLESTFRQQLRTVRDVAAASGKHVQLVLEGEEVEVDTAVVEHMRDPLVHLIRNAVDHGIEDPARRQACGKDPCGRLTLRAFHKGTRVLVQVADDGAGLDRAAIARRAVEMGLEAEGVPHDAERLAGLIFEPGFSTAERVSEVSGRGVGMDVVRRNVEALHGSVAVESSPGQGTTFTLSFPLTLAIIHGFRVQVSGEVYILPLDSVAECLELPAADRRERTGVLDLRGHPLPYLRLRHHFRVGGQEPSREAVVVVRHGHAMAGLAVDHLLGESQTVIRPLGRMFQGLRGISGSSILGDGRVALILDVATLLREATRPLDSRPTSQGASPGASPCTT